MRTQPAPIPQVIAREPRWLAHALPWIRACVAAALAPSVGWANPTGLVISSGSASAVPNGQRLDVTASNNAFLQWQSFNVAPGETTRFLQPSATSIVWNQIQDLNPSQIHGSIHANGVVVLMNQAGFYFGPGSFVRAAGLVVSTAPVGPVESSAGLFWQFSGAPPQAAIANYGHLRTERGGALFLIGEHIENKGTLEAPGGTVGLFSGQRVMVSERPDGKSLSASVELPSGTVDNQGRILADAGTIALKARVVNQDGLIQADSIREHNGVIELVASESIALGDRSVIRARGDDSTQSSGGRITLKSDGSYSDSNASLIQVPGGSGGGNGGFVEVSAPEMSAVRSRIDGSTSGSGRGGQLLIDPRDIVIGFSGNGSIPDGNVGSGDPPAGTLNLSVSSAFIGFSEITLQATRNITLSSGTQWDLAASTGLDQPGSLLKLEAGNNITLANGSAILGGNHWSVTLEAGRDFSRGPNIVVPVPRPPGSTAITGSILLNGTGSIETSKGWIRLLAAYDVTVGGGSVRTIGGGSIDVDTVQGNITTGTKNAGFRFLPTGYIVDADLGGISTAKGGNVDLNSGQDIISFLPGAGGFQTDAGSGAFGAEPGNVTIQAKRDVSGHFVVRNGLGVVQAGGDAGIPTRLLALSLVEGGWTVGAGDNILLQEVRNPNGVFNNLGSSLSPNRYRFDYASDAFVALHAGKSVQLGTTAPTRYPDDFSRGMPAIYPGSVEITAGAEGVLLHNDVVLFPSPQGNLKVKTSNGGGVAGTKVGDLTQWVVSDSGRRQYGSFGHFGISDHADTVLHSADSIPVSLDISGDFNGILLGVPKRAEIRIGGDMKNSRFDGQNLRSTDVTSIEVTGSIRNQNEYTSVVVDVAPDFTPFSLGLIYPPLVGELAGLESRFIYDAPTKTLTLKGRLEGNQRDLLLKTPVMVLDANGDPELENGVPKTRFVQTLTEAAVDAFTEASKNILLNSDTGYRIGGGGTFNVTAKNLDLGSTVGIVSQGPRANVALARTFTRGADIQVSLSGDLEMFATKIASLNGGDISIVSGGSIQVGSRTVVLADASARGIFTVDPSDVTVIARGNIDVNGSRIAAYDGGNVTVRSLEGNVDAGTGGSGAAAVEKLVVDPESRQVLSYTPTIPGSGILATTFPPPLDTTFPASKNTVGDIVVETPRGNIVASSGGVVQIPLNGIGTQSGTVTLRAGTKDANGVVIHQGSIDASGSGVIGSTVSLEATGDIKGLVVARQNIELSAQQNVNVTALAQGNVSVGAGGTVSGTIIGVGGISASGTSVDASLLSQNVSTSGDASSSQVGFATGNAAATASQSLSSEEQTKAGAPKETPLEDDPKRRLASAPKLTRTVGRVTVILPGNP